MLLTFVEYNFWANQKMAEVLRGNKELLDIEVSSSFPTLRKTILHITDAEYIWLQRMNGVSVSSWPSQDSVQENLFDHYISGSKAFLDFCNGKEDDFFLQKCSYKNLKGTEFNNTNAEIIMHCMNHSTFHRGQMVTMLRNLKSDILIPSTDMITFYREHQILM